MMLTKTTPQGVLRLQCDDSLVAHGEWALSQLVNGIQAGGLLATGQRIQFGWSTLTLVRSGGDFVVCEPDFDRDPRRDLRQDVSATLAVQAEMLDLVGRVGCAPDFPRFDQTILVPTSWNSVGNFEVERGFVQPGDHCFSGWRVNQLNGSPPTETMAIAELLRRARPLLQVLALPAGYRALFEAGRMTTIGKPRMPGRS